MKRRPTKRAFLVLLAGALLFSAGATAQAGWLFVLSAGTVGFVVGSLFIARSPTADVAREHPPTARVGDDVRVSLTIRNPGRRALPFMRVEDEHEAFEPLCAVSEWLRPGDEGEIQAMRRVVRRGVFSAGTVKLTTAAPLGFIRRERRLSVPSGIIVAPRWVELPTFPIMEPSSAPQERLHERALTGGGQEYAGVRDYRAGDPARWVHWRSSARRDQLVVREFEQEISTPVAVVALGPDTGEAPDSAFEATVSAACSIALYALSTGHPVELFRADTDEIEHLSYPSKGQILRWFAEARPGDASPAAAVGAALGARRTRGTLVLCTTTSGRALEELPSAVGAIQAGGARAIVVAARSSTWGPTSEPAKEESTLAALHGGRARVMLVPKGEDLRRCLLL